MPIKTKYFDSWIKEVPEANDKVMAITGTTSGTGYWASVFAIRKNIKVLILLNRKSPRVQDAMEQLNAEKIACGSPTKLYNVVCDLKDVDSVAKAADEINNICLKLDGLNVLANNAGFGPVEDYRSSLGYDIQMQVNYFSHFLLTKMLFPSFDLALNKGKEVRICQQSSGVRYMSKTPHEEKFFSKIEEGKLGGNSPNAGMERYHQSKLANITFAIKLSKMLKEKGYDTTRIKSVCSEPGFAETNLVSNSTAESRLFIKILAKIVIRAMQITTKRQSAADGSLTIAHACLAENVDNGDFFFPHETNVGTPIKSLSEGKLDKGKPEQEKLCLDPINQDLCWQMSEKAYGDFFEFSEKN